MNSPALFPRLEETDDQEAHGILQARTSTSQLHGEVELIAAAPQQHAIDGGGGSRPSSNVTASRGDLHSNNTAFDRLPGRSTNQFLVSGVEESTDSRGPFPNMAMDSHLHRIAVLTNENSIAFREITPLSRTFMRGVRLVSNSFKLAWWWLISNKSDAKTRVRWAAIILAFPSLFLLLRSFSDTSSSGVTPPGIEAPERSPVHLPPPRLPERSVVVAFPQPETLRAVAAAARRQKDSRQEAQTRSEQIAEVSKPLSGAAKKTILEVLLGKAATARHGEAVAEFVQPPERAGSNSTLLTVNSALSEARKYIQVEPVEDLRHAPELITTPRVGCDNPMVPAAIVLTKVNGFDRRDQVRDCVRRHSFGHIKPVFPLGLPTMADKEIIARGLANEAAKHGDLLIGNFADVYSELSTKTVMAMHWFQSQCDLPIYLVKFDDDVLVNWAVLLEHIQGWITRYQRRRDTNGTQLWDLPENQALVTKHWKWGAHLKYDMVDIPWWIGSVWDNMPVQHDPLHKNFEPDFPDIKYFPPYTSGPFYILHKEVCTQMVAKRAADKKHHTNEDSMLGLLANGTNLKPLHAKEVIPFNRPKYVEASCGRSFETISQCPCRRWWAVQTSRRASVWSQVENALNRCHWKWRDSISHGL